MCSEWVRLIPDWWTISIKIYCFSRGIIETSSEKIYLNQSKYRVQFPAGMATVRCLLINLGVLWCRPSSQQSPRGRKPTAPQSSTQHHETYLPNEKYRRLRWPWLFLISISTPILFSVFRYPLPALSCSILINACCFIPFYIVFLLISSP